MDKIKTFCLTLSVLQYSFSIFFPKETLTSLDFLYRCLKVLLALENLLSHKPFIKKGITLISLSTCSNIFSKPFLNSPT